MKHLFLALFALATASAFAIPATEKYVDESIKENNVYVYAKIDTKIDVPKPWVTTGYVLTKTDSGIAWCESQGGGGGGGGGMSLGQISYIKDDQGHMYLVKAMLNPAGQIVAAVEQVATNVVLMTVEQEKSRATMAEGALTDSVSNEVVRATAVEADLDERITSMSAVGRFLSTWNCTTGRPGTEPKETRMAYKAGDYYIVGSVATSPTNYIPSGTVYTNGTASTAFTTDTVTVNDLFRHTDDGQWVHVSMAGVSVTFEKISGDPRDNTKLAAEFALTDEAITNLLLEIERSVSMDTNLLSLVTAETNRAQVAEAALAADLLAETNRAQVAEKDLNDYIANATNNVPRIILGTSEIYADRTARYLTSFGPWTPDNTPIPASPSTGSFYYNTVQYHSGSGWKCTRYSYYGGVWSLDGIFPMTGDVMNEYTKDLTFPDGTTTTHRDGGYMDTRLAVTDEVAKVEADLLAETNRAQTAEVELKEHIESATNNVPRLIIGEDEIFADKRYVHNTGALGAWTPSHSPIPVVPTFGSTYYEGVYWGLGSWMVHQKLYNGTEWIDGTDRNMMGDQILDPNATSLIFPDDEETATVRNTEVIETRLAVTDEVYAVEMALVAETNRAFTVETNLYDIVGIETNRAFEAETNLLSFIEAETNRAYIAETNLQAFIEAETNRATEAEADLTQLWEDEADLRLQADNDLWEAHDSETNRAQVAEAAIASDLQAEVTRSTQADEALYTAVTNKQDRLPAKVNDKFLHCNAVSGALEWADAGGATQGYVEEGGKNLYVDAPSGCDSREALRGDCTSKGYRVGHYKATLSTAESPTGAAEVGYYTVTDLGDNEAYIEGRLKDGKAYFSYRKGTTWKSWDTMRQVAPTSYGTSGQVLLSNGTEKPTWFTPTNYWGGTRMSINGTDLSGQFGAVYAPYSCGISGQILRSNGNNNSPVWSDAAVPNTYGSAGQFLQSNGTGYPSWYTLPNFAGGTRVTLNGVSKEKDDASFYAPTSVGSSGQILKSNGSGSPAWTTPATYWGGTKVTLNGTAKGGTDASFYAPTSSGTAGQILKSNGSNTAPTWQNSSLTVTQLYSGSLSKGSTGTLSSSYQNFTLLIVGWKNTNGHASFTTVYSPGSYTADGTDIQISTDAAYCIFYFPSTTTIKFNSGTGTIFKVYGIN